VRTVWAAAAVVPPLVIWFLIGALGVNVPFEDDWDMLPVITRWIAGTLTFADFWQQHSEHRIAAVKGMFWWFGSDGDFDMIEAMRVGFALSVLKLALLVDIIRRQLSGPTHRLIAPLALASSLLMFSLVQHEDWFWATASLQFSLLNLSTVAVVWLLSRRDDSWLALAAAIVCAVVALLTEASGHVLWVTGGVAIWLSTERPARGVQRLAVWVAAAVSATPVYWWNLQWAPSSTAMMLLESPGRFVEYAGALLGLPFAFWMTTRWAAVVGYAGLIPLGFVLWSLFRSNRPLLHRLAPLLLFGFHGVLVCLLIALGRSSGDPDSALTSHYSFAPNLYWVGVITVTAVGAWTWVSTSTPRRQWFGLVTIGAATGLLATFFVKANVEGYHRAYTRSRNLQMALATLASPIANPRPVLRFLYPPDEQRADRLVAEMRESKLGLFATDMTGDPTTLAAQLNPVPAGPTADGRLDGGDCIGATGWAWDPAHPDAPVEVDVWIGDSLIGTVTANWFRWDLLAAGKGDGQHAFRFYFPEQSVLRTGRDVRVTFAGTNRPVPGSPTTIYCRE
jgi:hypothetical protein